LVITLCLLFLFIGYVVGVLNVFRLLRRRKVVKIYDWVYMAIKKDEISIDDLDGENYYGDY